MLLRTPQPGSIHRPLPTRSPAGHCRPAATRGAPPLRIVVVNREAILLTFVWQLTAFFQRVSPTRLPAWLCWSYADLARTSRVAAATRAVRTADWVVFCQATSKPLPTHVRRWADSWPHRRSAPGPAIGFFSLTTTGFDAEVKSPGLPPRPRPFGRPMLHRRSRFSMESPRMSPFIESGSNSPRCPRLPGRPCLSQRGPAGPAGTHLPLGLAGGPTLRPAA